jgi:DNA-directed RNA polymerase subunit RPC12/RpoP
MEQDIRRTKTCERCKANVSFEEVKYLPSKGSPNGMMLVCAKCVDEIKNSNAGKPPKDIKPSASKNEPKKSEGKTEFFCARCNYKFKVDESRLGYTLNLNCPYCGKPDRISKR